MPIYEFSCELGHRFEKIFPINECPRQIYCEGNIGIPNLKGGIIEGSYLACNFPARKEWSKPANINLGKPTIIFRNAANPTEVEVAVTSQDQTPEGFIREELRNPIERSKFEREQQKIVDVKNEMITESVKLRDNETRKNRHADIIRNMSQHDSGTQELLRFAMQRTRKKKERVKKTDVRLDINHIDRSNLTPT